MNKKNLNCQLWDVNHYHYYIIILSLSFKSTVASVKCRFINLSVLTERDMQVIVPNLDTDSTFHFHVTSAAKQ
jgi:hypothetical protein